MGRFADIVTRVQGVVGDATSAEAQAWVLEAARELNAESKWLTATLNLGTTTAGTGSYAVPVTAVDVYSVLVDGEPYELTSMATIEQYDAGLVGIWGGGVFAPSYSSTGAAQVDLRPIPDETGLALTGRQVLSISSPTWATDDPPFPTEYDGAIRRGAIAIGLEEKDERLDLAENFRTRFEQDKVKLRARKSGRIGKGSIRLRHGAA